MSGERRTLWGMVAVGLLVWLVAIPLLQVWLMVTGSLIVAWATFHLLTLGQDRPHSEERSSYPTWHRHERI